MKKHMEPYLKIPDHILSIHNLAPGEKMLLAHIYSFGAKGCWQSNQTLAEYFMVSVPMVRRWLQAIRAYIHVKNPKGYYRTIWAKEVLKNEQGPAQKCSSDLCKSMNRLARGCATTINNTIKENNERTIASPAPLPAGGQASATLQHRRAPTAEQIEKFKARFGRAVGFTALTPQQFAQRRAEQIAALRATTDSR
jgi:hypothetical protein